MNYEQHELMPLIDADIIVYRAGFAADAQVKRDFKGQDSTASEEELKEVLAETDYLHFALHNVKEVMERITEKFHPYTCVYLSGPGNFREQLATIMPYKGNRDPTHKPKYYKEIKDYLIDNWGAEVISGREADDAIGCMQWRHKKKDTVIVTIDKDLDMIPGYHYNWVKDMFYDISPNNANLMLFWQMIVGDRTDNIPGIPGLGPKTADRMIEDCGGDLDRVRDAVKAAYKTAFGVGWEDYYHEIGNLLWIQRLEGQQCPIL